MRIQEINRKHMTHVHHHTPNDINELNDELLSLAFDLAEMDQEAAAILMLVNKRFSTAAKLMSCWSQLDWSKLAQCAGKPNGQEKFASLMRTIKCWLGRKVILFNGRSCGVSSQLLTDDVIETVIRSAPNLEVCTLRGCPRITDIGLKRIAKATPKLNTFIMQWSGRNVYYPGIIEIVRGNSNLTTFAISCDMESKSLAKPEAGNELAEALVESCKHIRHLELVSSLNLFISIYIILLNIFINKILQKKLYNAERYQYRRFRTISIGQRLPQHPRNTYFKLLQTFYCLGYSGHCFSLQKLDVIFSKFQWDYKPRFVDARHGVPSIRSVVARQMQSY